MKRDLKSQSFIGTDFEIRIFEVFAWYREVNIHFLQYFWPFESNLFTQLNSHVITLTPDFRLHFSEQTRGYNMHRTYTIDCWQIKPISHTWRGHSFWFLPKKPWPRGTYNTHTTTTAFINKRINKLIRLKYFSLIIRWIYLLYIDIFTYKLAMDTPNKKKLN